MFYLACSFNITIKCINVKVFTNKLKYTKQNSRNEFSSVRGNNT